MENQNKEQKYSVFALSHVSGIHYCDFCLNELQVECNFSVTSTNKRAEFQQLKLPVTVTTFSNYSSTEYHRIVVQHCGYVQGEFRVKISAPRPAIRMRISWHSSVPPGILCDNTSELGYDHFSPHFQFSFH
jgi:hypothetical protein